MNYMEADIQVLKSEMRGLQHSISEVAAKMDMLLSMQVQLVRLQEQHDTTRAGLDRAFSAIRDTQAQADETEQNVSRVLNFVRGAALVGTLLFIFAQWYVLGQLATIERIGDGLAAVDRRVISVESRVWPDNSGARK